MDQSQPESGGSPVEILLIEDDKNDADLALYALQKFNLGNRIRIITDGAEALDFVQLRGEFADPRKALQPKLILLDLKLPKVSGTEVLEAIKAEPRTRYVPVVVMTSSREVPDLKRCYELGVNSYIVKPVDFRQFAEAVQQIGLYWYVFNQPCQDGARVG